MCRAQSSFGILGLVALSGLAPASLTADDVIHRPVVIVGVTDVPEGTVASLSGFTLDGERVVFNASYFNPQYNSGGPGLWAVEGNKLETVALLVDVWYHAQDGSETIFVGRPSNSATGWGVYIADNRTYRLIAEKNQSMPGRPNNHFHSVAGVAIDDGQFAFVGQLEGTRTRVGVYADFGDGLITVVDWRTPVPGGEGNFRVSFQDVSIEDGVVYFLARDDAVEVGHSQLPEYFAWDSATNSFSVLRSADIAVPGTQQRFDWTNGDIYCGGTYAFQGVFDDRRRTGVFADFGDGLIQVDPPEWFPGETVDIDWHIGTMSACGDTIAFEVNRAGIRDSYLFLYRHSDASLTLLLKTGDEVAGRTVDWFELNSRAVSDNRVAVGVHTVDMGDAVVIASLHQPDHVLLVGSDQSSNGFEEVVQLRQTERGGGYEARLYDAYTGDGVGTFALGNRPVEDFGLIDDEPGALMLATLAKGSAARVRLDYFGVASGERVRRLPLWREAEPLALATLSDTNGNGSTDVAVAGVKLDQLNRIQLRDGATGEKLAAFKAGGALQLDHLLALDNAAGRPALVLVGVDRTTRRARAVVRDALNGDVLYTLDLGRAERSPILDACMIDDLDGDGVGELAVARKIPSEGKSGWQVWNMVNGTKVGSRFKKGAVTSMKVTAIPDVGRDSRSELAVLRAKPNGRTSVEVVDPVLGERLGRYPMEALERAVAIAPLAPLDGNSIAEFVVLGEHLETDVLEIHDSGNGTALRYYDLR